MRSYSVVALLIFALLATPAAGSDAPAAQPVVHEEVSRVWDEITRQIQNWTNRWHERFGGLTESRGERPLITWMLSHRDDLNLSAEQVRNLERLRGDFERETIRREADLRVAEMDLSSLLESDSVDLKKAEVKVREIERLRADTRFARIRTIEQGKELLSQEQREKLRNMVAGTHYSRRHDREPR
ncbi:MAG: hypothetical protein A3F90_09220 [Deltaproteobacteria bacterium RIFCSPLOWO2_12_FULL_60_19]|nr:MAG: hypothetical protein A3F90_09220 [Deltaproteobacteria bacterium RIFCSPLOWO2_12_FULL_60_19]